MASIVQEKYHQLIMEAQAAGVKQLFVREFNNILYIDGDAPNEDVINKMWDLYKQIDPDYNTGDLVLNLSVVNTARRGNAAA